MLGCLLIYPLAGNCQGVKAQLTFGKDSIAIGENVSLSLEISHPSNMVVIFPDSSWNFKPFELIRTEAKLTQTEGGISQDAIIYHLRTFALKKGFRIKLPFQFHSGADTVTLFETSDSLWLRQQIASLHPPPPFQNESGVFKLEDPPNYLLWAGLTLVLLLLLGVLIQVMRKPIRHYLARRKVRQEWNGIQRRLKHLSAKNPGSFLDGLNKAWKDYLEPNQLLPLRSFTTTELKTYLPQLEELDEKGKSVLLGIAQTSDKVVYAGQPIEKAQLEDFRKQCHDILNRVFQERLSQV